MAGPPHEKACAAMHVMQLRQTDKTVITVSADRQTDLGTAVYVLQV